MRLFLIDQKSGLKIKIPRWRCCWRGRPTTEVDTVLPYGNDIVLEDFGALQKFAGITPDNFTSFLTLPAQEEMLGNNKR